MGRDRTDSPFRDSGPNLDYWVKRAGDKHECCSYCGSMQPDVFVAGLEDKSFVAGPTDKTYKIYVELNSGSRVYDGEHEFPSGSHVGKFYTPHFTGESAVIFDRLLRSDEMLIGYPGHFYRALGIPAEAMDKVLESRGGQ